MRRREVENERRRKGEKEIKRHEKREVKDRKQKEERNKIEKQTMKNIRFVNLVAAAVAKSLKHFNAINNKVKGSNKVYL